MRLDLASRRCGAYATPLLGRFTAMVLPLFGFDPGSRGRGRGLGVGRSLRLGRGVVVRAQPAPLGSRRLLGANERLVVLAADESLDALARHIVVNLARWALHEVARRCDERALQAAIETQLDAADGVGDDAGAVGRVPDLELELGV